MSKSKAYYHITLIKCNENRVVNIDQHVSKKAYNRIMAVLSEDDYQPPKQKRNTGINVS
jgi:hypothetical protein